MTDLASALAARRREAERRWYEYCLEIARRLGRPLGTALLAGAIVLGLAGSAEATILYAGGEDIDFTNLGGVVNSTLAGWFRSSWARLMLQNNTGTVTPLPPTTGLKTPAFTASSTIWVHFQHRISGTQTDSNSVLIALADAGGVVRLAVRGTGTNGQFKYSTRNAAGSVTDLVTSAANTFPIAALTQVDVKIVYGVSGSIDFYINGSNSSSLSFSGDNTTDGATQLAQLYINDISSGNSGGYSEIIVATTDTRTMGLLTIPPSSNGNTFAWSGTNPCTTSLLAQLGINDANFAASTVNNQLAECAVSQAIPTGVWAVDALVMSARAQRSATGPQNFDFVNRIGGTEYISSDNNPTTSFSNFNNYIQATNPATGNAWSPTDFTAAGYNIGLKSKP